MDWKPTGMTPGSLWLPAPQVDQTAWACLACDQFTSQPEYWREVALVVGEKPSTLKLTLPECYLSQAAERVPAIHREMQDYLAQGLVEERVPHGFILTERSTGAGARVGLVALFDLEAYDYKPGSQSLIRATEGTIEARLPPRMQVRRGAALELSHVLMLVDDPLQTLVEPLYEKRSSLQKLYDFPLMLEGGHVTGYAVTDPADLAAVHAALLALQARQGKGAPLYAVGDGNHSLAAAKAYWEEVKPTLTPAQQESHPARYALAEVENIHDDALLFQPIHRVLSGYDGDALMEEWQRYALGQGMTLAAGEDAQPIVCVFEGKEVTMGIGGSPEGLPVGTLQAFLDPWMLAHPEATLDYIHGEADARALARQPDTTAFLLPAMDKSALFAAIRQGGVLPRKTFSLGEAREKRYYLEARRLR